MSTPTDFHFTALAITGAYLIEPVPKRDGRGYFLRTFCSEEFARMGLATTFVQRSLSFNAHRGTLRGLHFQIEPYAETKIVRCTRGVIFDVIVDLRPNEPSFNKYAHVELRADRVTMLYIPPGCAHGFLTLEDESEVYYEITPSYHAEASTGIRWNDPDLAIAWPFAPSVINDKDRALPSFKDYLRQLASRA